MVTPQLLACDVAVIGGSLGGVAAALAAVESGATVILTEATGWIGGQVTSQAVSALDEHPLVEDVQSTRNYGLFRQKVREHYQHIYDVPIRGTDGRWLNPGGGWVSDLCFEPKVGLKVLEDMLRPHRLNGRLKVLTWTKPVGCSTSEGHIQSVRVQRRGQSAEIYASIFLDATDTGEVLPLANIPYVTGAEAKEDTGEADASPDGPHPERIQSFTYCYIVEFCPREDHTIRKPRGYEIFRERQPYSLTLFNRAGEARNFNFFAATPESPLPFWTYRRVFDSGSLRIGTGGRDYALINWHGNDYHWASPIDQPIEAQAAILDEARRLSLGFLYWLQTEVKRDDGLGLGYPELRLAREAVGTRSGLAMAPYWRESRRIRGLRRVVAEDILAAANPGKDQIVFPDSVGIGWYSMDLHPAVGDNSTMFAPTLPFQIPLGALIPQASDNLLASCKNIATTHLSNGAYRLHPVEWSIGEAAGSLAAFCLANGINPHQVHSNADLTGHFQDFLKRRGVQISWPQEALDRLKRA